MADPVRPPLGAEVYEAIAVEQHEVHERYWALLKAMPSPGIIMLHTGPHPPKQPIRLFKTLGDYACELFDIEANRYPGDPQLLSWITQLVQRTEAMVMNNLDQLEQPTMLDVMSSRSLTYHATQDQMRQAVRSALIEHAKRHPKPAATSGSRNAQIQPQEISPPETNKSEGRKQRLPSTVNSPAAARKLEEFLKRENIGQTEFAIQVSTTDRTIRSFRKSGRIRRQIFDRIARQMGMTREELLNSSD